MSLDQPIFETAEAYRDSLIRACPELNRFLLSIIVHDLRNSLSSALTSLQIMHEPDTSEQFKSDLLKIIEHAVERMEVIVEGSNSYLSEIHKRTSDQSQLDSKDKNSAA